jgi:hypothetical protein
MLLTETILDNQTAKINVLTGTLRPRDNYDKFTDVLLYPVNQKRKFIID